MEFQIRVSDVDPAWEQVQKRRETDRRYVRMTRVGLVTAAISWPSFGWPILGTDWLLRRYPLNLIGASTGAALGVLVTGLILWGLLRAVIVTRLGDCFLTQAPESNWKRAALVRLAPCWFIVLTWLSVSGLYLVLCSCVFMALDFKENPAGTALLFLITVVFTGTAMSAAGGRNRNRTRTGAESFTIMGETGVQAGIN
ncbi:MAG: hypothetical protein VB858_03650 [Planctomycetaceae bacterium]